MKHAVRAAPRALLTGIAALCLSGCDGHDARPSEPPPLRQDKSPVTSSVDTRAVPASILEELTTRAASARGIEPSAVSIERAESVTWGDTSLGCPQPNQGYLQRVVSGYWVVVHAAGEEFDFRVTSDGQATRCTGSTRQAPVTYPPDT
ncbi:MAG: hypothetical protein AAF610_12070 [Pseudomonadota bacterium]